MRKYSQLSQGKSSSKSISRPRQQPIRGHSNNIPERPEMNHIITSDAGRSPIPSSRNGCGFKDHDGGDSFAVSLQYINQEGEAVSINTHEKNMAN